MRSCRWLLLLLAWGAVQCPMAWCDHAGLHAEIPLGHGDHEHEHDEAHERVDLDLVLVTGSLDAVAPRIARLDVEPVRLPDLVARPMPERAGAPPGQLSAVRLL